MMANDLQLGAVGDAGMGSGTTSIHSKRVMRRGAV